MRTEEVPTPSPGAGQVLIRVAATSINLSDWECLRGSPLDARIGGLRAPARRTLGSDIAGWDERVGEGVTRFQHGDEVYGDNLARKGGFAEFAVAPEAALAPPQELTFAQVSTIPKRARSLCREPLVRRTARVLVNAAEGHGLLRDPTRQTVWRARDGVDNALKLDFMFVYADG